MSKSSPGGLTIRSVSRSSQVQNGQTLGIIAIIALVAELAPRVIDAGKSVADLWRAAGGIIADAENTGKVDADAALRLKALVDAQLATLDRNTNDAMAG